MEINIKNKVAIVTGGTTGMGEVISLGLLAEGCKVSICCKSEKNFKYFKNKYKKLSKNFYIEFFDATNEKNISYFIKNTLNKFKKIDILVNNAGILFNSLFQMTSEKQLQEMFQVNYFSQVYLTQIISRGMAKNKTGNIIFVSSTSGINGDYGRFAYSSSKAAILSTVKTISKELSNYNIRVNAISPGLTETDLMLSNTKENIIKSEIEKISLKRIASTNEIADIIMFLASEKSSYINGQNIVADGGTL